MTITRPFSYDSATGIRETWEYDELTDKARIITTQDAEPILEANKARQVSGEDFKKRRFWHAAHIPLTVIADWQSKGINIFDRNDAKKIYQMLDDPAWAHLRVNAFRMGRPKQI
jgi:hypothetical protein